MSPGRPKGVIILCVRVALGGALLGAGVVKMADPVAFVGAIESYALTPQSWNQPIAALLPWLEVLTGGLLLCGLWTRSSALVAAGMLICFVGAMGINLARGADVDCGCFGPGLGDLPLWASMVRTSLLLAAAVLLLRERQDPWLSVDRALRAEASGAPREPAAVSSHASAATSRSSS